MDTETMSDEQYRKEVEAMSMTELMAARLNSRETSVPRQMIDQEYLRRNARDNRWFLVAMVAVVVLSLVSDLLMPVPKL